MSVIVIPAKAGIQSKARLRRHGFLSLLPQVKLDSRLRGNDGQEKGKHMKKKPAKKKTPKVFTASNGLTVEYTPDPRSARPLTATQLKNAKWVDATKILSAAERQAFSEAFVRLRGRPKKAKPKINATLRMDADVLDGLRATGPGWQTRANNILKTWLQEHA